MSRIVFFLVLVPFLSFGQDRDFSWWLNRYKYSAPMAATAGFLDASAEVMYYNYDLFDKTWGIKNDEYWNPHLSYKNKWKNGDYRQGEAFFLSSTTFSFVVEGRKLVRMSQRVIWGLQAIVPTYNAVRARPATQTGQGILLTMSVTPFTKEKLFPEPWWVYGVDFVCTFGAQALAFEVTNEIYRSHLD